MNISCYTVVPNAVVVYHDFYKSGSFSDASKNGSEIQQLLAGVNALRGRLIDENYSNLIVTVFSKNPYTHRFEAARFTEAIGKNWEFRKPASIIYVPTKEYNTSHFYRHRKLTSGEHFPQNFNEALLLACDRGKDPLGHAILKAALPFTDTEWTFVSDHQIQILDANNSKVDLWKKLLSSPSERQKHTAVLMEEREQKLAIILQQNLTNKGLNRILTNEKINNTKNNTEDENLTESPTTTTIKEIPINEINEEDTTPMAVPKLKLVPNISIVTTPAPMNIKDTPQNVLASNATPKQIFGFFPIKILMNLLLLH